MIKYFVLFLLFSNITFGQSKVKITYYKDKLRNQVVKKGPYKLTVIKLNDSVTGHIFSKTRNERKIWEKYYLGKQPFGTWIEYDKKGKILNSTDYNFVLKYGKLIPKEAFTLKELGITPKNDPNIPILKEHLSKQFRYPQRAMANGYQGTVLMQFTINKLGKIGNIRVVKGVHFQLDFECYKIVNSLENVKPHKFNGENVMTYYTLPIKFKLTSE